MSGHTILAGLILISFVVFLCLLPPIYLDEPQVYQQFGSNEELTARIITPVIEEIVKARIPARSLEKNLIERAELKQELETKAKQRLESYGIVTTDLSVLNVTASDEFTKATEDKQIAEQKAISDKIVAEQELQKADYESKKAAKESEAMIARAKGQAEAQRLLQSSLSPEILQKQAIEKWDGKFPVVMSIGVWKKLKQKMDERHIKRCPNIGHEKSKH